GGRARGAGRRWYRSRNPPPHRRVPEDADRDGPAQRRAVDPGAGRGDQVVLHDRQHRRQIPQRGLGGGERLGDLDARQRRVDGGLQRRITEAGQIGRRAPGRLQRGLGLLVGGGFGARRAAVAGGEHIGWVAARELPADDGVDSAVDEFLAVELVGGQRQHGGVDARAAQLVGGG